MNQVAIKILKERNRLDGLYLLADLIEIEKNNKEVCRGVQLIQSVIARSLLDTLGADSKKLRTIVAIPNAGVDYKDALVTMSGLNDPGKEVDLFTLMLLKQSMIICYSYYIWNNSYPDIEKTVKKETEKIKQTLDFLKKDIDDYYSVITERQRLRKEYEKARAKGEKVSPPQFPEIPKKILPPRELFALAVMIEFALYKNISVKIPNTLRAGIITILSDSAAPEDLKKLI